MRSLRFVLAVALFLGAGSRSVAQPVVPPGADAWVTTSDIGPFVFKGASLEAGGRGLYNGYAASHAENVDAGAGYDDPARGISVHVRVTKHADPVHIRHFLEALFRSHSTGRMHGQTATVDRNGNTIYFYCSPSPDCKDRVYAWRSGSDRIVQVAAKAFVDVGSPEDGPDPRRIPCPEPAEVLDEYLDRYPSALTVSAQGDEQAKQWLRDRVGLELARAELDLEAVASVPEAMRSQALFEARSALIAWSEKREKVFGKPDSDREAERIARLDGLGSDAQIRELSKIRDEYRAWWAAHQNDPVVLPPP